jgi:hypothetical protein
VYVVVRNYAWLYKLSKVFVVFLDHECSELALAQNLFKNIHIFGTTENVAKVITDNDKNERRNLEE